MKKIRVFAVAALILAAFAMCAACTSGSSKSARKELETALKALDQAYAIDITMNMSVASGDESSEVGMQLKAIDKEENQTAYIHMDEGGGYTNTLYFSQGYICESSGDRYYVYQANLDEFIDDNGIPAANIDMDKLAGNIAVKKTSQGKFNRYSLMMGNMLLKDILGDIFDTELNGNFALNAWVEKKSGGLKRLEYAVQFKMHDENFELFVAVEINAVNGGVSIDIPDEVAAELAKYINMPTLTLLVDPLDTGYVYGGGKYKEGDYVHLSVSAYGGYIFNGWYQGDTLVSDYYYYSFYMPSDDLTLTARFEPEVPTYYVSVYAEPYNYGNAWGNNYIKEGGSVTVTASPYQGYVFLGWYEDDEKLSEDLEYTFLMPARFVSLRAKFGQYVEDYTNTQDGAVKYYDLFDYKNVIYDAATDKFIVLSGNNVDIYTANMVKQKALSFLITPAAIDADNGILAIGFGDAMQIHLYDLTDNTELKKIQATIGVHELLIDGDTLIYSGYNSWPNLMFYSIGGNKIIKEHYGINQPLITLNRVDHIVYLAETGSSSSRLMYFDSQTGEELFNAASYQFGYNSDRVLFDGKYVHYYGGVYDRLSGDMFSSNDLTRHYNGLTGFNPLKTVYDSDGLAFVFGGQGINPVVGVYDNAKDKYIYGFNYAAVSLEHIGGTKYFAKNLGKSYIAIIDLSLIPGSFKGNITPVAYKDTVTESSGIKTLKHFESYELSATDGDYVYLLSDTSFKLYVYDAATLQQVYTERFMMKPACLDAYGGRLAIGFGNGRQFRVYDTADWSFTTIKANECVFSIALYGDRVFYMPVDQHCGLFAYSLTQKKHVETERYYRAYYPTIAINREDGILYIGSRNSSSSDLVYVDLNSLEIIYQSAHSQYSYNSVPVYFDGEFVHFYGKTFDKNTGMAISNTHQARQYDTDGYSDIKTLYDDEAMSVFTAKKGAVYYTVFYDLTTGESVFEIAIEATAVFKTQYGYVIFSLNQYVDTLLFYPYNIRH